MLTPSNNFTLEIINKTLIMNTIYDRYGGEAFWERILDDFYIKNLEDELLRQFFQGKNINRLKLMNRQLLAVALRTTEEHFSVSVKRVHKDLSINAHLFDRFAENLRFILNLNGISGEDLNDIMTVVTSFKEDITGE
jgi:truncated hemoglobin YjbI